MILKYSLLFAFKKCRQVSPSLEARTHEDLLRAAEALSCEALPGLRSSHCICAFEGLVQLSSTRFRE